jgi:hypothetical protein
MDKEIDNGTVMKQRYTKIVSDLVDIVATEYSAILNAFELNVPDTYKKNYVKTKQP